MSYKNVLPMIAAVAAIACGAETQAASVSRDIYGSETVSVRVKLADLDLASPAGAAVGLRRIRHAAREACGPEPGAIEWTMSRAYRACIDGAVDQAVGRLGNPIVSALNGHGSEVMAANGR